VDTTAVLTIRADGTHLVQMTPSSMIAGDCDWSPDGKRLVFISHPLVSFNFDPVVSNLFTIRPDGSGLRQLTHSTTSNHRATQAHFTPDGHIIYTRVTLINTGRRSRGRGECEAGCRTAGYSRGDAIAEPALRSSARDSPAVSACLAAISSYDTGCPPSII